MLHTRNIITYAIAITTLTTSYIRSSATTSEEDRKTCQRLITQEIVSQLRNTLGVNVDIDDARKQFGFDRQAKLMQNCSTKRVSYLTSEIKIAINQEIDDYEARLIAGKCNTTEIHTSDVQSFVSHIVPVIVKKQPHALNANDISNKVIEKINTGQVSSRITADGENKLYNIAGILNIANLEVKNAQEARWEKANYISPKDLEAFVAKRVRECDRCGNSPDYIVKYIKDNNHAYANRHGTYNKALLIAVVDNFCL